MRILQAPSNIANQAWLMAEGLRSHGHDVEVWEYGETTFGYPCDRSIVASGPASYLSTVHEAVEADFDVVHFHFARSLVPATGHLPAFWDLPVWRALGVRVVFTFHGTDVRLRSHHVEDDQWSFYRFADIPCDEERIAGEQAVIRHFAQQLTVGSVLDLPYVPEATYLPKTVDTRRLLPPDNAPGARPVVLHAPSRRATKGTDLVLAALDTLRDEGVAFDVDLVEGLSHAETMERMARADIVVEKLLGGDAGVTSLEAMALGKVAVARIRDEVRERHPDLPVVSADPETAVGVLRELLEAPERRAELGRAGRAFVEREHAPSVTGQRLEELYSAPARTFSVATQARPAMSEEGSDRLRMELESSRAEVVRARGRNRQLRARLETARQRNQQVRGTVEALRAELELARPKGRRARAGRFSRTPAEGPAGGQPRDVTTTTEPDA